MRVPGNDVNKHVATGSNIQLPLVGDGCITHIRDTAESFRRDIDFLSLLCLVWNEEGCSGGETLVSYWYFTRNSANNSFPPYSFVDLSSHHFDNCWCAYCILLRIGRTVSGTVLLSNKHYWMQQLNMSMRNNLFVLKLLGVDQCYNRGP